MSGPRYSPPFECLSSTDFARDCGITPLRSLGLLP